MAKKVAGAAEVRAYLKGKGVQVGSRGLFSAAQIEQFQSETGKVYQPRHVEKITVKGVRLNASGRKTPVQRKVTLPEVRTWARGDGAAVLAAEGIKPVGAKGVLRPSVLAAFAAHA